jgi:hypothetical protein
MASLLMCACSVFVLGTRPPAAVPAPARWNLPLLVVLATLYAASYMHLNHGMDIANRGQNLQKMAFALNLIVAAGVLPFAAAATPLHSIIDGRFPRFPWTMIVVFLAGLCAMLKIAGIVLEEKAQIDVWFVMQAGPDNLAKGLNPYTAPIPEAEKLGSGFGAPAKSYVYPPSVLLLTHPFVMMFGDSRYAYVLSDLATALMIILIGRSLRAGNAVKRLSEAAALLVLLHPKSFAKTWNDPLIAPFLSGFVLASVSGMGGRAAAVAAGLMVSMKQYMIFTIPSILMTLKKPGRIALFLAAGAATSLPFLIWDAGSLIETLVVAQSKIPYRWDGMTLSAFLQSRGGPAVPHWLGWSTAAVLMLVSCLWRKRGLTGMLAWIALTYTALFFFSSFAFPNYYHFVTSVMLLGGLVAEGERLAKVPAASPAGDEPVCGRQ